MKRQDTKRPVIHKLWDKFLNEFIMFETIGSRSLVIITSWTVFWPFQRRTGWSMEIPHFVDHHFVAPRREITASPVRRILGMRDQNTWCLYLTYLLKHNRKIEERNTYCKPERKCTQYASEKPDTLNNGTQVVLWSRQSKFKVNAVNRCWTEHLLRWHYHDPIPRGHYQGLESANFKL